MSHYTVLVIGPAERLVEALAPFDENLEVDEHFEPLSDRVRAMIADGHGLDPDVPDDRILPLIEGWFGRPGVIEDGVLGFLTTANPDAKWDYWTPIDLPVHGGGFAETLTKADLDVEALALHHASEAAQEWEHALKNAGLPAYFGIEDGETQEAYVARQIAATRRMPVSAYAVLGEGVWRAPGRVGWFGTSSAGKADEQAYKSWFESFWASLPDNAEFTLVDCHI